MPALRLVEAPLVAPVAAARAGAPAVAGDAVRAAASPGPSKRARRAIRADTLTWPAGRVVGGPDVADRAACWVVGLPVDWHLRQILSLPRHPGYESVGGFAHLDVLCGAGCARGWAGLSLPPNRRDGAVLLLVEGHAPVVSTATGPRSTKVEGAPPPTKYDTFYYLAEGFTALAFDSAAPNRAFAER